MWARSATRSSPRTTVREPRGKLSSEPLGESAGGGIVRGQAEGLLGGAAGVGSLVVRFEGQSQMVIDIRLVGQPGCGGTEVGDRLGEMPQLPVSHAAELARLTIVGG